MAKATQKYFEQNDLEISFEVGDVISIVEKCEDGTWRGKLNGKVGLFPSSHVEVIAGSLVVRLLAT